MRSGFPSGSQAPAMEERHRLRSICPAPETVRGIQESVPSMKTGFRYSLALATLLSGLAVPGLAQQPGPIAPDPGKEVKRLPSGPSAPAPPIPAAEIIRQFTAREDEFSRAHLHYGFHRTIQLQEFPADGTAGGRLELEQDVFIAANGKRYEKVTKESSTELKSTQLEIQDLKELARIPFFPLTTEDAQRYTLTYAGSQPLDELNTYLFRVQPRRLERTVRQLEGLVYVDDHDMAIVKVYGRWIVDVDQPEGERPFVVFDVQRENVDGKYWFPDYMRSDGFVSVNEGQTRLRLTIKMTGFKAGAPSPVAPQPAPAPASPPASGPQATATNPKPPER